MRHNDGSTHSAADANDTSATSADATGATDAGANHASATHAGWRVPVPELPIWGLLQHCCWPVLPRSDRPRSVHNQVPNVVPETGSYTTSDPGANAVASAVMCTKLWRHLE